MWIKRTEAKRIIIVDNEITADPFMAQIFSMAAPPGVKLELMTTDQAGEGWKKDQFGSLGPIVCLFKNVPVMYKRTTRATISQTAGGRHWRRPRPCQRCRPDHVGRERCQDARRAVQ